MHRDAAGDIEYPGPALATSTPQSGGAAEAHSPVLREPAKAAPGPQTLVQPDLNVQLALEKEIPVPTVVIWARPKAPVKTIVAPLPQKPAATPIIPSLVPPNDETNPADIEISSTEFPSQKLPVLPSNSSPIVVRSPQPAQTATSTATQNSAKPTPAAVASLSRLKMPNGTVALPPVNESAARASRGEPAPSDTKEDTKAGTGNPAGNGGKTGAKPESGAAAKQASRAGGAGQQTSGQSGPAQSAANGSGEGNGPTTTHITLPITGQFSSVVVGNSLQDEYPEIADVWSGRMTYTVYLHVGLAKSWILQYALPRAADAAAGGDVSQLDAPWPYSIVRPNLAPSAVDADALLVHGFVNEAGRFESLHVAFPPDFGQSQFVVGSLQQWQFRPATENGKAAKVEVLLIIPEDVDSGSLIRARPFGGRFASAAALMLPHVPGR